MAIFTNGSKTEKRFGNGQEIRFAFSEGREVFPGSGRITEAPVVSIGSITTSITSNNRHQAVIPWTVTGGRPESQTFRWGPAGGTTFPLPNAVTVASDQRSVTVDQLTGSTEYTFVVQATNSIGNDSDSENATTGASIVPPNLSNLSFTATTTAVTANWSYSGGTPTTYNIRYGTSSQVLQGRGGTVINLTSGTTSRTISGLSSNTTYYFRIFAEISSVGSDILSGQRATGNPAPPAETADWNFLYYSSPQGGTESTSYGGWSNWEGVSGTHSLNSVTNPTSARCDSTQSHCTIRRTRSYTTNVTGSTRDAIYRCDITRNGVGTATCGPLSGSDRTGSSYSVGTRATIDDSDRNYNYSYSGTEADVTTVTNRDYDPPETYYTTWTTDYSTSTGGVKTVTSQGTCVSNVIPLPGCDHTQRTCSGASGTREQTYDRTARYADQYQVCRRSSDNAIVDGSLCGINDSDPPTRNIEIAPAVSGETESVYCTVPPYSNPDYVSVPTFSVSISGPSTATRNNNFTYQSDVSNAPGSVSYQWSVSGAGSIVGSRSGSSVTIRPYRIGTINVSLSVTSSGQSDSDSDSTYVYS